MKKNLTNFQKDLVTALEAEGYFDKYGDQRSYGKYGCADINLTNINSIASLFKVAYNNGRLDKTWEIQRMLGIQ